MARAKVRAAKRDLYRRLVLEAAEAEFAARGYEDARIQDIASEAGVSLGTLYNTFEGKADIYQGVHDWRLRELLQIATEAARIDADPDVRHTILSGIEVFVRWLVDHPHYLRLNLVHGASWAASPLSRSDIEVTSWQDGIGLMAALMEAGQNTGVITDGDPQTMSRLLSAAQQVYISAWAETDQTDPGPLVADIHRFVERCFFCSPILKEIT